MWVEIPRSRDFGLSVDGCCMWYWVDWRSENTDTLKDIEKYNESDSDFEMFIEPQKDLLVFNKLAYPLLALLIKGLVLGVIFLFTHKEC